MFKPDSKLTIENLEDFLNYHKEHPLPEWFPTVELKREDYEFTSDENRYSPVTHIKKEDYINQGLTILPYIKGQLSYIEAGDIVISYPFTGCAMAAFKFSEEPDKQYVGHIAIGDTYVSDDLYNQFIADTNIKKLCVFEPYEIPFQKSQKKEYNLHLYHITICYGIITSEHNMYWIVTGQLKTDKRSYVIDWGEGKDCTNSFFKQCILY